MRLDKHEPKLIQATLNRRDLINLLAKLERGDPESFISNYNGVELLIVRAEWGDDSEKRNDHDTTGPYAESARLRGCLDQLRKEDAR